MYTSAPSSASSAEQRKRARVRELRVRGLLRRQPGAPAVERPLAVATDDVLCPGSKQRPRCRRACRADSRDDDPDVLDSLADDLERVQQRGQDDDRGSVLVVVEDGNVQRLAEPPLDLEAARRGDVLEVDAAEAGGERDDRADDLVDILGGEADRKGVDAAELLEQDRLALHDRESRLGPDVAEPEHGGPVGDDGDRVLLDRERPDLRGIRGDGARDPGDAGRVCHRQVVTSLERRARRDLELSAEMKQERSVGDVLDLEPFHLGHGGDDPVEMCGVAGEHRHVAHLLVPADADQVDRSEEPARPGDRGREGRERPWLVPQVHSKRRAERGGRMTARRRFLL